MARIHYAALRNSHGHVVNVSYDSVQNAIRTANGSFDLINLPDASSYPLSTFSYFIIRKSYMTDCESVVELVRYIVWFTTSEKAATIAAKLSMVTLENRTSSLIISNVLQHITCRGQNVWALMLRQMAEENSPDEDNGWWKTALSVFFTAAASISVIVFVIFVRHQYFLHKETLRDKWKIPSQDITLDGQIRVFPTAASPATPAADIEPTMQIMYIGNTSSETRLKTGRYNDSKVLLVQLKNHSFVLTFKQKKALLWVRDNIKHPNVMPFLGMTKLGGLWYSVHSGMIRGTLMNVLRGIKFQCDIKSLIIIVKRLTSGISYLHNKDIIHGHFSGDCCFLDSSWKVTIAAWAGNIIYPQSSTIMATSKVSPLQNHYSDDEANELMFTAPERLKYGGVRTAAGDIYSLAMVCQELLSHKAPYSELSLRPPDILHAVMTCGIRPCVPTHVPQAMRMLIEKCWETDPAARPTATLLESVLNKEFPGSYSLLDSITTALEQYALNIESNYKGKGK